MSEPIKWVLRVLVTGIIIAAIGGSIAILFTSKVNSPDKPVSPSRTNSTPSSAQTTQYFLKVNVNNLLATATGEGSYDEKEKAFPDVHPRETISNGVKRVFVGFDANVPIAIDEDKEVNALWGTKYLLTVDSLYSSVSGGGWYDEGSQVTLVPNPAPGYQFVSFSPSSPILVDGPKIITANFAPLPISDNFNDGVIDSNIWITNGWSGGILTESGGTLYFETETSQDKQIRPKVNIGEYDDFSISLRIRPDWVSPDKNVGFWLGNLAEGDTGDGLHYGYIFQLHGKTQGYTIQAYYGGEGASLHNKYDPPNWIPGTWYNIRVERIGSTMDFYINGVLIARDSTYASQMTDLYWVTGRSWKEGRYGEAAHLHIDDFEVVFP